MKRRRDRSHPHAGLLRGGIHNPNHSLNRNQKDTEEMIQMDLLNQSNKFHIDINQNHSSDNSNKTNGRDRTGLVPAFQTINLDFHHPLDQGLIHRGLMDPGRGIRAVTLVEIDHLDRVETDHPILVELGRQVEEEIAHKDMVVIALDLTEPIVIAVGGLTAVVDQINFTKDHPEILTIETNQGGLTGPVVAVMTAVNLVRSAQIGHDSIVETDRQGDIKEAVDHHGPHLTDETTAADPGEEVAVEVDKLKKKVIVTFHFYKRRNKDCKQKHNSLSSLLPLFLHPLKK